MALFPYLGKLPRTPLNLALILLSGLAEGFGLALFVPLLEVMTSAPGAEPTAMMKTFQGILGAIGLTANLPTLLLIITAAVLGSLALAYAQKHSILRSQYEFIRDARNRAILAFFESQWPYLSSVPQGAVVDQISIQCLRAGATLMYEVFVIATSLQILILGIVSSLLSWQLVLAIVGLLLMGLPILLPLHRRTRTLAAQMTVANRDLSVNLVDYLRGTKLVKVTASEQALAGHLRGFTERLYRTYFQSDDGVARVYFLMQALPVVMAVAVIGVSQGLMMVEPSVTLVFLLILGRIAPRVAQFQQYYQSYTLHLPSLKAVEAFAAAAAAERETPPPNARSFSRLAHDVLFDDIHYTYPGAAEPALKGVSLTLRKGEVIALVGSSGAGKSTLVDILCDLRQPTAGRILVDGHDLAGIDPRSWRRRIGYVTQEITVFNASVRDNLTFGLTDASDADIARALEIAHLSGVIDALPSKLDTVLGESGLRLSGGERQRLSLARALVRHPDILILDEATSALDAESERAVQNALETIAPDLATVIVAHRLSTIRNADRIYVLEAGRIVEQGTYDELLARSGRFAELHGLTHA